MNTGRESTEETHARLLADPQVQDMIRHRAFDLYQQREGRPGNPADDWFQAESEVLAFWIEKEKRDASIQLAEGAPVSIEEPGSFAPVEETPVTDAVVEAGSEEKKAKKAVAKPATPRKSKKATEESEVEKKATEKKASAKKTSSKKSGETKSKSRKTKSSQPKAEA